MGPCLWGTEYSLAILVLTCWESLQWGRAFGARNTSKNLPSPVLGLRFNGAVPLGHGIRQRSPSTFCSHAGFNGAVPLGHGIRSLPRRVAGRTAALQWGRAFGARNTRFLRLFKAAHLGLQWGRAFGARNTICRRYFPIPRRRFNGAVPLGHGIRKALDNLGVSIVASMGPCLWGTEYSTTMSTVNSASSASMGPCLWGTEYLLSVALLASPNLLQWGRAFGARNTAVGGHGPR